MEIEIKIKGLSYIVKVPEQIELKQILFKKSLIPWTKKLKPRKDDERIKLSRDFIFNNSVPNLDIYQVKGNDAAEVLNELFNAKATPIVKEPRPSYIG